MLRVGVVLLAVLTAALPAIAQQATTPSIQGPPPPVPPEVISRDAEGRVTLRATRLPGRLSIDGVLDESFYETVQSFGDFVQQEPDEGQPSAERTEIWIFYDDDNLYVSARLWESEPGRRVATEMRRDANTLFNNDHLGVTFDSFYDRRNGYGFLVNALGGIQDWSITNDRPNNSWNGLWDVRSGTFDEGWTTEIRFPFRSFRFREGGTVWSINFRRMVRWRNEISFLSPIPAAWARPGFSRMSAAATVMGLEVPGRRKNIDIKPYALGSVLTNRNASPSFSNDPDGNIGVDVKWGIRQTLVADLTVNTDFAQVEDDLQQVNLTRFSLLFPEKRDFFLEGVDTFNFAGGRAGARGTAGGGGFGGSGRNTSTTPVLFYSRRIGLDGGAVIPIRVGGRLLGRSGPWQFGALNVQTGESTDADTTGTNFTVVRVNRDVFARGQVGAIFTRRDPVASTPSGQPGPHNLAYGIDTTLTPTDDVTLTGYVARTKSPDLDGEDASYRGRFDWNADRYGIQAEHLTVGANFNPEVGFLRRTAFRRSYGLTRFSPRPGWTGVRKVYYQASVDYITDTDNRPESKLVQGTYQMDLENSDTWSIAVTRSFERLSERFEVGKDLFVESGEYTFNQVRGSYNLGQQRPISGSLTALGGNFYDGTLTELTWRGRVELTQAVYLEPTVSWNRVTMPSGTANTNLMSTRATYSLSPRMFVSALVQFQSRSDSLTSNARFRWEYEPGSELFVVYSDGRTTLNEGFPALENRSFVVKITKLWRW